MVVSAKVENSGTREGNEVVQLYLTDINASVRVPIRSLAGVERVHLKPGERRVIQFTIEPRQLAVILQVMAEQWSSQVIWSDYQAGSSPASRVLPTPARPVSSKAVFL